MDVSAVLSDSGLTAAEMALLAGDLLDAEGGLSASLLVPPLFGSSNDDRGGNDVMALDTEVV